MSKEITRGSWKLKSSTPLLKCGSFHALLFLIGFNQMGC
jgi:hypothetical protein